MKKIYTIYGYFNIITLMWYVGRTSLKVSHRAGKNGSMYRRQLKFWSAIQTYGWPNFECHILVTTDDLEESYRLEQYWIEQKDSVENGYNTSTGGKSGSNGTHPVRSDDFRRKVSESHKGEKNHNYGKHFSEDWRDNLAKSNRNNPKQKLRPVQQFTREGQFIKEYPSIMEAYRQTSINRSHIISCCKGQRETAGEYIWKYS